MIPKFLFKRLQLASVFFAISALYGLLMRWQHVQAILPVDYINVMQAHSHVTFLGWGFLSVITLITFFFTSKNQLNSKVYTYPFWIMSLSILGMLISFPWQGYKVFSIVFLTIFLVTSYVYLFFLYKRLETKKTSTLFIKWAIIYYYLSSLGIWGLSIISVKLGKGDLYHHAISFYTHFLYNGFFVMALFGLLSKYIENNGLKIDTKVLRSFYYYTNLAVIPTFVLSVIWDVNPIYLVAIGLFGSLLQLYSLKFLWKINQVMIFDNKITQLLIKTILVAFVIKLFLQAVGSFPIVAQIAIKYKSYFVIGYIHLFTLGFMSLFIVLLFKIKLNMHIDKIGISLLFIGILVSESILFLQGGLQYFQIKTISNFDEIILMASILMFLGITLIVSRLKILTI